MRKYTNFLQDFYELEFIYRLIHTALSFKNALIFQCS